MLRRKVKNIKVSSFYKDVFKLAGGTALAQLIPFISLPFLSRYYSDYDFGILALYVTFSMLLTKISTGKYEFAIVLEEDKKDRINLVAISGSLLILFSALIFLIFFFFGDSLSHLLGIENLGNLIFLVPVTILSFGFFEIGNFWLNAKKKYGAIAKGKVVQNGGAEGLKLAGVYAALKGSTLILGKVFGEFVGMLYVIGRSFKDLRNNFKHINKDSIFMLLKKHKKFPLFSAPSTLFGNLINFVYISLFIQFYGNEFVGNVSIASQYIVAGFAIISRSFSQVFYREIVGINDPAELMRSYLGFLKKLSVLSAFVIVLTYLIPQNFVLFVLGDEWIHLLGILKITVLWVAVQFVSGSLSFIYIKLGKQDLMLWFDFFHLFLVTISILAGHYIFQSDIISLWFFTISQILYYLLAIFLAFSFIKLQREN